MEAAWNTKERPAKNGQHRFPHELTLESSGVGFRVRFAKAMREAPKSWIIVGCRKLWPGGSAGRSWKVPKSQREHGLMLACGPPKSANFAEVKRPGLMMGRDPAVPARRQTEAEGRWVGDRNYARHYARNTQSKRGAGVGSAHGVLFAALGSVGSVHRSATSVR